jgi:predicted MFS family arabinose efflux permease
LQFTTNGDDVFLPPGRRLLLAAVCSVAVATIYVAQPVLALVRGDLGVADSDLGWVVAAGQVGYLVGLVALVPLGDVLDRRRLIGAQLLLAALGTLGAAASPTPGVLLACLGATGLSAVVVQTAVAFAADLSTPAERGRTLGAVTSGVVLGILGARVLAGVLAGLWGWRSVYLALVLLLLTLGVVVLKQLPADPRPARGSYGATLVSLGRLFGQPLFVSRGLVALFLFASFGTLWSGLALPLAAEPWSLSPAWIGMFGVAGLAGALGAARSGRWADAGRADAVTGAALVLLALSWLGSGQATWSLWPVVAGVVVLDFAVQAAHVSNQALLTSAHPDRTSTVLGGYMVFYSLGSALGAATTTAAYDVWGWTGSAALGAGFTLGGLLAWALGRRSVTRSRAATAGHGPVPAGVTATE